MRCAGVFNAYFYGRTIIVDFLCLYFAQIHFRKKNFIVESLALEHLRKDLALATCKVDAPPLHWPLYTDVYESLLRSIVFRQLNGKASFALANRRLQLDWNAMNDNGILAFLTQIKGAGRWTVEMILIFTLR